MPQNRSTCKSDVQITYDDRGGIESVTLDPEEVMRRGWLYKPDHKIHPALRAEIRRHRLAYEQARFRQELDERCPDKRLRGQSRFWKELEARQPAISEAKDAAGPEA